MLRPHKTEATSALYPLPFGCGVVLTFGEVRGPADGTVVTRAHKSLRNATMSASSCGVSVMPANSLNMNVYCSATSSSVFDELSWK